MGWNREVFIAEDGLLKASRSFGKVRKGIWTLGPS